MPPSASRSAALAWEGPEEDLNRTENAQPALLAASIAYLEAVRARWAQLGIDAPDPAFAAGHSMGQYTALVAAGALDLADAVRLVRDRGQLMQASGAGREGGMAALIGLDDARLPELVARRGAHGVFGVANRNSPGQVVVSGERAAVEASLGIAKELGAKRAIELPVSVAAHSPLMAEAAAGMRAVLADIDFHDPPPPLLANADARPITTADGCRAELVDHLTTGVDWVGAVEAMRRRRHHLHRDRARPGPDRPDQADRPRRRRHRRSTTGRRGPARHPVRRRRRRRRLASRRATHAERNMRQPDFTRRVVVTGLGVISPVGNDKDTAWANLVNGRSGLGRHHQVRSRAATPTSGRARSRTSTPSQWMDAKAVRRSEPAMWYGVAAAKQAVADAGLEITDENREDIGVVFGSGAGGQT